MALTEKSAHRKDMRTTVEMQHRHFAAIAQIIVTLPDELRQPVMHHFAEKLKATNKAFDKTRFICACIPNPFEDAELLDQPQVVKLHDIVE